MKFDYTHGQKAKYMVTVYGWNIEDHYYYHDYKSAKEMYKRLAGKAEVGISVSLWDMVKDIKKDFVKA